jgi:hypothetical protein
MAMAVVARTRAFVGWALGAGLLGVLTGCGAEGAGPARCDGALCVAADAGQLADAAPWPLPMDASAVFPRRDAATPPPVPDAAQPRSTEPGSVVTEPTDEAQYVFDQSVVRSYNLVIAQADLDAINANPAAEQSVSAIVEHEGQRIGPVGVRYKGSIGAFLSPCTLAILPGQTPGVKVGKCSLKIDFNHVDPALRFHGLKQLNLHAMGLDKSQLRDRLGYALFREAGVAAPRAMHARVLINGQLEGLFVAVEQVDKHFAQTRFTEGGEGNLYKEVWPNSDDPAPYTAALQTNTKQPDVSKMLAFKRAIDQGPEAMSAYVDRDYVMRFLAVDRLISNDDGAFHWYCQNDFGPPLPVWNHNYYWYEAELAPRLWIVPWDLDSSFQGSDWVRIAPAWNEPGACSCAGDPAQRPAMCDPLTARWASYTAEYEAAVDRILAGPFAKAIVDQKLDAWSAQIESFVTEAGGHGGAPAYLDWQLALAALRGVVDNARTFRGR